MNTSGLITLFKLAPKMRDILVHPHGHYNEELMRLFQEEIPDFERVFGDALTAYSTQGYLAAPLVNNPEEYRRTYFNWQIITLIKRSGITPTNYKLLTVDASKFLIQYMITGGFKNELVPVDNDALLEEFDDAKHLIDAMKSM
ncbi:protein of unknown function [Pseudotevenvirus RB43]|uniref:Uncharacterized protein n=2 Tax=Pseudotevenvirus RB43 TaxID=115991 RepID=Q56BX0_9CAUD|nr:hypothetical protein RB43ORF078w [Escherichia phage RB43]AAX78600.1 hypothetical protein RB43ORF078w [Escherichia phage RB43]CCK73927.1 protein of unknown function [Pseudotevenvirus RB43]CCL97544.1 protein of unknown function [Pseudotevenvirus RB43]